MDDESQRLKLAIKIKDEFAAAQHLVAPSAAGPNKPTPGPASGMSSCKDQLLPKCFFIQSHMSMHPYYSLAGPSSKAPEPAPGPEARPESRSAVAKLIDSIPTEPAKAEGSQGTLWSLASIYCYIVIDLIDSMFSQPLSCSTKSSSTRLSWMLSRSQATAARQSAAGWARDGPDQSGMRHGRCTESSQVTWDGFDPLRLTPKTSGSAQDLR